MIPSTPSISPLRQRMLEDMRMRKLEPRTQEAYIRAVRKLAAYLKRSPDAATVEDLRNFQLHLVDTGSSPMTLNATLTGLKFFFDITLGRIELMAKMQPVKLPRTLPVVLSCEEVSRLLAAAQEDPQTGTAGPDGSGGSLGCIDRCHCPVLPRGQERPPTLCPGDHAAHPLHAAVVYLVGSGDGRSPL